MILEYINSITCFKNVAKVLDCEANQPEATIEQTTEPVTETTHLITNGLNFQFDLNTLPNSHKIIYGVYYNLPLGGYMMEHGKTITVSGSCYPDFVSSGFSGGWDCARIAQSGLCDAAFHYSLRYAEQKDDGSWVTLLHCPECGCTTTGSPNFYDLAKADKSMWTN